MNEHSIKEGAIRPLDSKEGKYASILRATLELISEYGFHGTSMAKVAKKAGVSAGIIYHYFSNKDELIEELYIKVKREFSEKIITGLDEKQSLRKQIRELVRRTIEVSVNRPEETIFMEQFLQSPYNRQAIQETVDPYYEPIMQVFYKAKHEQMIKPLPDPVIFALTLEVAITLAKQHAAGDIFMDEKLIEKVTEACWEAIRQ
ncbi:TetR/AcrR family transcriptional regulator [Bacillus sp. FJAT-42376]|uniref:TetR/AcrR family transcriptional regulator n=1 Tax=Bacillus sp. FJAT-42376 TaxID=2014076 RepID=UPI000F4F2574|nr:TetR/AcrR family transcriptional regulator [Bacillus sp. FJAT-42376]AZB41574.1 TetR/AcrR family transcriptional regulator [Bacillus sp. FJAT-42376]